MLTTHQTLKASADGSAAVLQAVISCIAQFEAADPLGQEAQDGRVAGTRAKSDDLSSFVDAVGALNAILDMRCEVQHLQAWT